MGYNGNGKRMHYSSVNRSDVPQGRKGKHRKAVSDILGDLSQLDARIQNFELAARMQVEALRKSSLQRLHPPRLP